MPVRRSWLTVLAALLAIGAPRAAAGSSSAQPPTLTGATTLVVMKSAFMTVRVAQPLRVPVALNLTVSDPAHFIAAVLVGQASNGDGNPTLITTGFPAPNGGWRYTISGAQFPGRAFAPGLYWLYVLASAPERVDWRLPLSGHRQTLHPVIPATHVATTTVHSSPMTPGGPTPPYATTYGHSVVGSNAEVWGLTWARIENVQGTEDHACFYDGNNPAAVAVEQLPAFACDGDLIGTGTGRENDGDVFAVSGEQVSTYAANNNLGLKISNEIVGTVTWAEGRNIWFDIPRWRRPAGSGNSTPLWRFQST